MNMITSAGANSTTPTGQQRRCKGFGVRVLDNKIIFGKNGGEMAILFKGKPDVPKVLFRGQNSAIPFFPFTKNFLLYTIKLLGENGSGCNKQKLIDYHKDCRDFYYNRQTVIGDAKKLNGHSSLVSPVDIGLITKENFALFNGYLNAEIHKFILGLIPCAGMKANVDKFFPLDLQGVLWLIGVLKIFNNFSLIDFDVLSGLLENRGNCPEFVERFPRADKYVAFYISVGAGLLAEVFVRIEGSAVIVEKPRNAASIKRYAVFEGNSSLVGE